DRRGRGGMVAGDHLDRDAGRAAIGDGADGLLARWIDEADDAGERQPAHVFEREALRHMRQLAEREAEHALAVGAGGVDGLAPEGGLERFVLSVRSGLR